MSFTLKLHATKHIILGMIRENSAHRKRDFMLKTTLREIR